MAFYGQVVDEQVRDQRQDLHQAGRVAATTRRMASFTVAAVISSPGARWSAIFAPTHSAPLPSRHFGSERPRVAILVGAAPLGKQRDYFLHSIQIGYFPASPGGIK